MISAEEVDKAIAAHGQWKTRLKQAIEAGELNVPVETIRMDNQCAFGKWLHGPVLTAADRGTAEYQAVRKLHAEFHLMAARVAELALAGDKSAAEAMIALGGEYAGASAKLTRAMLNWKAHAG